MSVINDEDDLEAEALDLYKAMMTELFRHHLDHSVRLTGIEKTIEDFASEVEEKAAFELAGACLSLIANFAGEAREITEAREPDPEGETSSSSGGKVSQAPINPGNTYGS